MRSIAIMFSALLLTGAAEPTKPLTPTDVVAAAPASAWRTIDPDDLLVIDFKNGGRVVVQLAPSFAPVHVANIRAFARSGFWDGASAVYRVQDNYVAQWGLGDAQKTLPNGAVKLPPHEYWRALKGLTIRGLGYRDSYAPAAGFVNGWPVAYSPKEGWATLTHCYAHVGVARDLAPDTGSATELYAIIGHAPRQLDRNIAVVGRVIDGIDRLSVLPRGTEALGFYKERSSDVPITAARLASQLPAGERPSFQYMDTNSASFGTYLRVRANRSDQFYKKPAGGIDLCNVPVPIRRTPAS